MIKLNEILPSRRARLEKRRAITAVAGAIVLIGATVGTAGCTASPSPGQALAPPSASRAVSTHGPTPATLCSDPAFAAALRAHDTDVAVKAAGGGARFRAAVVSGAAPCVHLNDPAFAWLVVDKHWPFSPKTYAPSPLVVPARVANPEGFSLRADAAAALTALVAAAKSAGAGEIGLNSGYRSYRTQVRAYDSQVSLRGVSGADRVSARPGFSEHQSGLAADVVACGGGCGTLDALAGTSQDRFILAHAWEFGWIIRYEAGHSGVTGYSPEPWHLRYIGVQLAKAYHDGRFHTLEEFFDLPAAPTYRIVADGSGI